MSRFIDKLKQVSRSELQPMGFRKTSEVEKQRLILVAEVRGINADVVEGADAILLEGEAKKLSPKTDLPIGVKLVGGKNDKAEVIDFVIFTSDMPATIAEDGKIGRVMAVEASLEAGLLRALGDLPLDALFITGEGMQNKVVTWQYLMLCRRLSAMSGKPVLAAVPPDVSRDQLQILWDAGVSGVVVAAKTTGDMKKLRSIIDGLEIPVKHKRVKANAIVPSPGEAAKAVDEDEEEEE